MPILHTQYDTENLSEFRPLEREREREMSVLPNDPDNKANDWDEEGEKGKGKTQ